MGVIEVPEGGLSEGKEFLPQQVLCRWVENHSATEVYSRLKEKVFGQDDALRQASILVYSFLSNVCKSQMDAKYHFLIEGSSGCGKSTFAKALKQVVPCPVIIADATQITASGYKGVDASDLLRSDELDMWWGCGILILDELDKLMEPMSSSSSDNFHRAAVESFLKMMDGGHIKSKDGETDINCDRLLIIGMGAFTPAREEQKPRAIRKIGFEELSSAPEVESTSKTISKNMMSRYCGSEQFMGRFLTVLHFNKVGKDVYRKIAMEAISEIRWIHGRMAICLTDSEIDALVDEALHSPYGCRGIRSAVWEWFLSGKTVITEDAIGFLNEAEKCRNRLMMDAMTIEQITA